MRVLLSTGLCASGPSAFFRHDFGVGDGVQRWEYAVALKAAVTSARDRARIDATALAVIESASHRRESVPLGPPALPAGRGSFS